MDAVPDHVPVHGTPHAPVLGSKLLSNARERVTPKGVLLVPERRLHGIHFPVGLRIQISSDGTGGRLTVIKRGRPIEVYRRQLKRQEKWLRTGCFRSGFDKKLLLGHGHPHLTRRDAAETYGRGTCFPLRLYSDTRTERVSFHRLRDRQRAGSKERAPSACSRSGFRA